MGSAYLNHAGITSYPKGSELRKAFLAILLGLVVALSFSGMRVANASPVVSQTAGTVSCTTSTTGYCTLIPHGLRTAPSAVIATAQAPNTGTVINADSFTETTFRVRAYSNGVALNAKAITFSWAAFAAGTTVPTTTPTMTPTTKPTTAPPTTIPPTTQTSTPDPTTAPPDSNVWPNASNTGVPAGTTLTNYTGPCTITAANTVIDSKTVNCALIIQAANVTISKSKVNGQIWLDTDDSRSANWSATVDDSEAVIGVQQLPVVCCGNMTIHRSNFHGGENALMCEEHSRFCYVQDSYLHGQTLAAGADWHLDGFISDGTYGAGCSGTWCIEMVHNNIICDAAQNGVGGCTADLAFIPNFATSSKIRVYNNYLGANTDTAFCTYGGEKSSSPYPHGNNITYDSNVFARGTTNKCAAYGPVADFSGSGSGNVFVNNKYDDGTLIPSGEY